MFPLTVDPRAGSENLIPALRDLGTRVTVEQMEFGDVAFAGNGPSGIVSIGIEHKRLDDVLACITTGRFAAHQLVGMQPCYDIRWLIVQGEWKAAPGGELLIRKGSKWKPVPGQRRQVWFYSALEHWLMTMSVQGGFNVHRAVDLRGSATFIKALHSWWQKPWEGHDGLNVFNDTLVRSIVRPGITRRMAAQVPGIGWELSGRVARHFGTPKKMVNADVGEWLEVAKVGPTIAKRAVWLMANGREEDR